MLIRSLNSAAVRRSPKSSSSLWLWRTAGTNKDRMREMGRKRPRTTILWTLRLSKSLLKVRRSWSDVWPAFCAWVADRSPCVLPFVDSRRQLDEWQNGSQPESLLNLNIPLLMQNKVPDGFEDGDHIKVDLRPESVSIHISELQIFTMLHYNIVCHYWALEYK